MTDFEWRREFEKLAARVAMLENAARDRSAQSAKVPKRLPFSDDTPLSELVRPEAYIELCATVDAWRPLLKESSQKQDDLLMSRFDFLLVDFPYERFYKDLGRLISNGGFRYSTNVVAWYFVLHSNLTVSHYTLYTALLSCSRRSRATAKMTDYVN